MNNKISRQNSNKKLLKIYNDVIVWWYFRFHENGLVNDI